MRTLQLLTALTCGVVLGTAAPLPRPAVAPEPVLLAPIAAGLPDALRAPAAAPALRAPSAAPALRAPSAEAPAAAGTTAWTDTLPAAPAVELALPGPYPRRDARPAARGGAVVRITESSGEPPAPRRADAACPRPARPGHTGPVICIREAHP